MNRSMKYTPPITTGLYAMLTAVAVWFPFSPAASDPLDGIFAVVLTQPWSTLGVFLLDSINPMLLDQGWGIAITLIGGVTNALLLYLGTKWVVRRFGASA